MESKTPRNQTPAPGSSVWRKAPRPTHSWAVRRLLALVTSQPRMYVDEGRQAWLIARDSGNLLELVQHYATRVIRPVVPADLPYRRISPQTWNGCRL